MVFADAKIMMRGPVVEETHILAVAKLDPGFDGGVGQDQEQPAMVHPDLAHVAVPPGADLIEREVRDHRRRYGGEPTLDLADAVCRLVLDDKVSIDEVILAAKAYKKARGL